MNGLIRGLDAYHEHAAQKVARDTRPLGQRFADFINNPSTNFIFYITSIITTIMLPVYGDLIFFITGCLFLFVITRQQVLPFRLPKSSTKLDYHDLIPGTFKPKPAGGIAFFGNDRITREELWFTNDDLRTHILMFGSTGSGKTEALISMAFNALIHASGFIYIDGKGDNSLYAKIFSMVRSMGREDDLLIINFMTGARDVIGPQENRLSNTMNPFSFGSSSMLSQLVVSLMDQSSGDSNADMWKGRAINFVESLMKILTVMRDEGHILLDANTIRDYFILEKLESIIIDKKFPIGENGFAVTLNHLPTAVLDPLKNYLLNLPGYNPKKKGSQGGEVREQHGFITMQLTRVFGSLSDTYGHILRTKLAEVDVKDVVLNRRILVVLLPALEKSPEELANLGKIIIASLKTMMASGLGDAVEGNYRDVIIRKPTNSPSPYICILDEYGYYAVKGFAVVAAQARSLGFSAVFAGQDLPAFQKASKEEAASIGANCNIKICMKLEDPQETWEYFNKTAGETYVTNVSGFQMNSGSLTLNYMDSKNASVDRRQRIELLDLKDQREGEAHIFFKSTLVRAEMFHANPKPIEYLRLNHCLKVDYPEQQDVVNITKRLALFSQIILESNSKLPNITPNDDINIVANTFEESDDLNPYEQAIAAIISLLEQEIDIYNEINKIYDNKIKISAFTKIHVPDIIKRKRMLGAKNEKLFAMPFIRAGNTLENIKHIERLTGANIEQATIAANKIIADIDEKTSFPPSHTSISMPTIYNKQQYLADVMDLITKLGGNFNNINNEQLPDLPDLPNLPDELDLSKLGLSNNELAELEELLKQLNTEDKDNEDKK